MPTQAKRHNSLCFNALGLLLAGLVLWTPGCATDDEEPTPSDDDGALALLDLWQANTPAFGVFVPDERPRDPETRGQGERLPPIYSEEGGRALAANPLYDFLFLNLEGAYDPGAVQAIHAGLTADGPSPKALLVRIPPLSADGEEAMATRIQEILAVGADGIVVPHVRGLDEAQTVIDLFANAGADVWSPTNPGGDKIAMLMLEDPDAVEQAEEIAALPGFSLLACGIGSLTGALGGDREAAEAGNLRVLAAAQAAGLPDMITANAETVEGRIEDGFLALLMAGPSADDIIRQGRAAAGRN